MFAQFLNKGPSRFPQGCLNIQRFTTCFEFRRNRMEAAFRFNRLQLITLLALLFVATFTMAQGHVTGSISGTVEDAQGAVVANAKVVAKDVATNRQYPTDSGTGGFF